MIRPQILQRKICSPSGEIWVIFLWKIRNSANFGGRFMNRPYSSDGKDAFSYKSESFTDTFAIFNSQFS